jgi:hypothetical protein
LTRTDARLTTGDLSSGWDQHDADFRVLSNREVETRMQPVCKLKKEKRLAKVGEILMKECQDFCPRLEEFCPEIALNLQRGDHSSSSKTVTRTAIIAFINEALLSQSLLRDCGIDRT